MVGAICKREVCTHPVVTIRCFGWSVFWRVLIAGRKQTFLGLIAEHSGLAPPQINAAKFIGRCIQLEKRANHLYDDLARRWGQHYRISRFLRILADQEWTHVELLHLCRKLASKKCWRDAYFARWEDAIPDLEQSMDDVERRSQQIETERDILQLVLSIEGSEINRVFSGIIDATNSPFVNRLGIFRQAEQDHISFICDQVSQMEPELSEECEKLQTCCLKRVEAAACQ